MAHLTIEQLTELHLRYIALQEEARARGLNADLHISMCNSPESDQCFDAVSIRVEKEGAEDSLYWRNITDAACSGWMSLRAAFIKADETVNEWEGE